MINFNLSFLLFVIYMFVSIWKWIQQLLVFPVWLLMEVLIAVAAAAAAGDM